MMHGAADMWDDDHTIYDDGEWITWTQINSHLARLEFAHRFPHFDPKLVPIFHDLLQVAQDYHYPTDSHRQVYGDLGELYGVKTTNALITANRMQ